ncbi:MAG: zinc ribbon domain-containing protein [Oscillospiraceae bacterium]|nr:zinc ribbon domain-containing protein [Oscillospiraceae bacterium]
MTLEFDVSKLSEAIKVAFESEHPEYAIPDPPDELFKMLEYLPEEFAEETEEKYIDALMLAAQTSYENGLYQFAYVQYHMLFMTAVYYAILKVSIFHEEELKKALYYLLKDRYADFWKETNTKNGKLYFGSFALINESDVFMLLRVVGLDSDLLGELQKLVRERNKYAHANGQLQLTSDELFMEALNSYNTKIQKVVELLKTDLIDFYKKTVSDPNFHDPDIRAYLDPDEQMIQEFIKEYSLSRVELNWLRKIRLSDFDGYEGETEIKTLHSALIHYYRELTQDEYQPFDDPYVLYKYKNNATEFVERELEISAYECGKEGGEFPVYECPECGEEQLAYDADGHRYHCFACGANYTDEDLTFCEKCGSLMRKNGNIPICHNCVEDMMRD